MLAMMFSGSAAKATLLLLAKNRALKMTLIILQILVLQETPQTETLAQAVAVTMFCTVEMKMKFFLVELATIFCLVSVEVISCTVRMVTTFSMFKPLMTPNKTNFSEVQVMTFLDR